MLHLREKGNKQYNILNFVFKIHYIATSVKKKTCFCVLYFNCIPTSLIGGLIGLGLLNKHTFIVYVISGLIGLVLTPSGKYLTQKRSDSRLIERQDRGRHVRRRYRA
ncbi:hypothetical protein CSA56_16335 [candidate division KSB3 bacterium]|uniref:Uncharacterized protein n=1 Tax=candidate division KSB3 bacterium TaxID=2044937 RepID=A0A2G6K954_9BACT|nr:MAG: hypothetical protein CSA56_16335 [candidate division KSB3 bacterium]